MYVTIMKVCNIPGYFVFSPCFSKILRSDYCKDTEVINKFCDPREPWLSALPMDTEKQVLVETIMIMLSSYRALFHCLMTLLKALIIIRLLPQSMILKPFSRSQWAATKRSLELVRQCFLDITVKT